MIYMSIRDYESILAHCRACLPNEACGLLGGTRNGCDKEIKKVYLLTNTDKSDKHFSMDVKEQLATVKDMRINGFELLGSFHSHPKSPSFPSEEDLRLAIDSHINYLIVSLMDTNKPEINAFNIAENGSITEERLVIEYR